MAESKEFISKSRLDALTDGVFAFAMTLLVINLDLPEDFHPTSAAELISALLGLGGTFIAYVITFFVLASFWLGRARTKEEPQAASGAYAWSLLSHLFFVTLLPLSMIVAGRSTSRRRYGCMEPTWSSWMWIWVRNARWTLSSMPRSGDTTGIFCW